MPSVTTVAVFAATSWVLIVVPGPNLLFILARGFSQGRRAALASTVGVETGILVHVLAAAAGVSALLAASAAAFTVVKFLGAAYLIYLGVATLRGAGTVDDARLLPSAAPLRRLTRQGFVVSLLNPKVALFFLAFLPQFVDPSRGGNTAQLLVLGLVFFAIASVMDGLYAVASGSVGSWLRRHPAALRRQRYGSAGLLIALGLFAAAAPGER